MRQMCYATDEHALPLPHLYFLQKQLVHVDLWVRSTLRPTDSSSASVVAQIIISDVADARSPTGVLQALVVSGRAVYADRSVTKVPEQDQ